MAGKQKSGNSRKTTYEATITGRPSLHDRSGTGRVSADDDSDRRMIILQGLEWSVDFDRASGAARSPSPPESVSISARRLEEGRGGL